MLVALRAIFNSMLVAYGPTWATPIGSFLPRRSRCWRAKVNAALDAPRPEPVLPKKKENPCLSDRQCVVENTKPKAEANDTLRWVAKPARDTPPQPPRAAPPAPLPEVGPPVAVLSAKEREEAFRSRRKHNQTLSDEPTKVVDMSSRTEKAMLKRAEVARASGRAVPGDLGCGSHERDIDYSRPGAFYAAAPQPKTEKERFEDAVNELCRLQPALSKGQAMSKINQAMLAETAKDLNPHGAHGAVGRSSKLTKQGYQGGQRSAAPADRPRPF